MSKSNIADVINIGAFNVTYVITGKLDMPQTTKMWRISESLATSASNKHRRHPAEPRPSEQIFFFQVEQTIRIQKSALASP